MPLRQRQRRWGLRTLIRGCSRCNCIAAVPAGHRWALLLHGARRLEVDAYIMAIGAALQSVCGATLCECMKRGHPVSSLFVSQLRESFRATQPALEPQHLSGEGDWRLLALQPPVPTAATTSSQEGATRGPRNAGAGSTKVSRALELGLTSASNCAPNVSSSH